MHIEITSRITGEKLNKWRALLSDTSLHEDGIPERVVLVFDGDDLIATGGRDGNILKMLAVSPERQGEDLLSSVITELRRDAFQSGYNHLFLYTKPSNKFAFSSLFFYPIVQTDKVLFMENKRGGIDSFVSSLPEGKNEGINSALVMNCNPFTLGHKYVIEKAASESDRVYVFVLSEKGDGFSPRDRLEMVKKVKKLKENKEAFSHF